jgi:hypothetical protein
MWQGTTVISQVQALLPRGKFAALVTRYDGDKHVHFVDCWSHFWCLLWAQATGRVSLRDIEMGVAARGKILKALGVQSAARSTVARANRRRSVEIVSQFTAALAAHLSARLSPRQLGPRLPVFSIDSTVIELCQAVFPWALHQQAKAGIELHMLWDHQTALPRLLALTPARERELATARTLSLPAGSILCCDRGYLEFRWFGNLKLRGIEIITRAKSNWSYRIVQRRKVVRGSGVTSDYVVGLKDPEARRHGPPLLRRIRFVDVETQHEWIVMTTLLEMPAATVVALYRKRWEIELFFKWIKQNLKILRFWGTSRNAVLWQIYTALCLYIALAYLKAKARLGLSLFQIRRRLAEVWSEQIPLQTVLTSTIKLQT